MKIYGNTVGTTLPKPNLDQTDPKKGDFIKGDRTFLKGDDGAVFVPSVDEEGILSWTNNGELPNPEPVKIVGEDGYTPVKGTDYYTEEDRDEMVEAVLDAVPRASAISVDREADTTTMTVTLEDNSTSTLVIRYDEKGDPGLITVDGREITLEFIYHILELFRSGDPCEDITGGWVANSNRVGTSTQAGVPTLSTTGAMTITLSTDANSAKGSVMTVGTVDLTAYSKLCFQVSKVSGGNDNLLGYTAAPDSGYTMEASVTPVVGLNTLDISAASGSYTIAICVQALAATAAELVIDSIYLE